MHLESQVLSDLSPAAGAHPGAGESMRRVRLDGLGVWMDLGQVELPGCVPVNPRGADLVCLQAARAGLLRLAHPQPLTVLPAAASRIPRLRHLSRGSRTQIHADLIHASSAVRKVVGRGLVLRVKSRYHF